MKPWGEALRASPLGGAQLRWAGGAGGRGGRANSAEMSSCNAGNPFCFKQTHASSRTFWFDYHEQRLLSSMDCFMLSRGSFKKIWVLNSQLINYFSFGFAEIPNRNFPSNQIKRPRLLEMVIILCHESFIKLFILNFVIGFLYFIVNLIHMIHIFY